MFKSLINLNDLAVLMDYKIEVEEQQERNNTMKLVKKNKLTQYNGLIMKGDKVVAIDCEIICLANELEDMIQRKKFELEQSNCCCCKKESNATFERIHEGKNYKVQADTPLLDAAVERSLEIMDEIDRQVGAEKMNKSLEKFKPLLEFADSDKVIIYPKNSVVRFRLDTPVIGSVLELTVEKIYDLLAFINDGITYDDRETDE